ncbi:MAG TPA: adenylate/guanylate cyclase domain-containing protein [Actinomycetota bacterium]|nr:adenylate/guanylate cyclase domain-containing protein [Actinomycetota bacterium]
MTRRERKVVTVLFADLAGFTSRAESMDPEDVAALLDPYHARLKGELERFGGTVEKFIGDAVMAIFGAPLAHEDDAERAVRAALAIRDWASEDGIELRVGINTGEALVTLDAKATEGETMAAGDVVNTAARLQSAAPIGEIFVGEQTYHATDKAIEFAPAEAVQAKGKAQPVAAWQALGARSRVSVERVHGATLVGRGRELEMLHGALDRARQERSSQLLTLIGVPGIGKSRLVLELFDRIERETEITSWRSGRCLPYGEGVTFWALGEMVKAQAGILEDDDEEETRRKLHAAVDDPWIESHLRALVGLSGGADGGGDRREEAFTAWRRFFEGLAEERPLVLVFEDIHWADESLLDFIDHLVDWSSGVPLLVLCTARPELMALRPSWGGGKPNAHTISLSPLSDEETTTLLSELLERTLLQGDAKEQLLARAGGNPLYAEEYVRALREHGRVEQLPVTVQGMIAARLDLLESEEKSLVQSAAVIGKTFWLGALVLSTGGERSELERRLHALERKEFVRRERSSSLAGDVEYSFRHLLFRDVAYGQIPRAERAERHRGAAQWLESLGRSEDHSEMLAYHYLQALELGAAAGVETQTFAERAQSALADAGDRAFALHALVAATRHYRAALDLLPEGHPRRARVLLYLGRVLRELGERNVEVLEQARDAFLAAGNAEAAGDAESALVDAFWIDGDRDRAFAHLLRARELLDPLPSSAIKAHAIVTASRFMMLAAQDEEAIRLGREALAIAEELGLDEVRASALNNIGSSSANLGHDGWRAYLEESARIAEAATLPFELVRAKGNLAANLWAHGDLRPAFELWNESEETSGRFGQLGFKRWFSGVLVPARHILGDWDGALSVADIFIADVEAGRPHYLSSAVYLARARIRLARDDTDGALADAEHGFALGTRAADPQALLPAYSDIAHVLFEIGDRERAASLASEFLSAIEPGKSIGAATSALHELSWTLAGVGRGHELAEALKGSTNLWARAAVAYATGDPAAAATICAEMGAVTEEAHAHMAAGRTLKAEGREEEAEEQLRRALDFFRSVGASRYVRECEARSG